MIRLLLLAGMEWSDRNQGLMALGAAVFAVLALAVAP